MGDVGGLKGECSGRVQKGFGSGDPKAEKGTVVDHITKTFAEDPNDLRSRISKRKETTDEKAFVLSQCNADRVEDRTAFTNVCHFSDGVPNLAGVIPRVNLPTGKPLPPNLGFEQHYPIPNDDHLQQPQQQVLPSFQDLQQPALQLPPRVPSVSSRSILLLEREVQLQEDLAIVIGQKSLMRDTDSRECYIAVLKQEIAIRKQLEQVSDINTHKYEKVIIW